MDDSGSFVGRGEELDRLRARLDLALDGQGQICFIGGEAGAGKTALAAQFCQLALSAHEELLVSAGACDAQTGSGDAYLPFREALDVLAGNADARLARGPVGAENRRRLTEVFLLLGEVLIEIGPDLIDLFVPGVSLLTKAGQLVIEKSSWLDKLEERLARSPKDRLPTGEDLDQGQIFEQYVNVLRAIADRGPLVVVVEDLQWADAASLGLLFRLGRRLEGSRLLVIGTYRPNDVALGRAGTRHPLEPVLAEMKRYFGDVILDLDEARARKGRAFVDAYLDTELNCFDDAFREGLYRHTRGHPLFTVELVREMRDRGDLVQDEESCWHEAPGLDWADLPARVEGVIDERIGRLSREQREWLTTASVEGERFTAEVVARVQGAALRPLIHELSGALQKEHRLVTGEGVERLGDRRLSRYRFAHSLMQTYLYGQLDKVEAPLLHEEVGNALEAVYGDAAGDISVQLAYHFERAGVAEKARRYLRRAAQDAAARFAHTEAMAYLARALAMTPEDEVGTRYALLRLRERVYDMQGDRKAQAQDLATLHTLATQQARLDWQAEVALRGAAYALQVGRFEAATRAASSSASLAAQLGEPLAEARAHHRWGRAYWQLGDYIQAQPHLERALALATEGNSPPDRARCLYDLGVLYHYQGDDTAALDRLETALHLYDAIDDRRGEIRCLSMSGIILARAGRHAEATAALERALQLSREVGWRYAEARLLAQTATHYGDLGNLRAGRALQRQAITLFDQIGDHEARATALDNLGLTAYHMQRPDEARDYFEQALAAHRAVGSRRGQGYALTHLGYALVQLGEAEAAAHSLEEAVALRRETGADALAIDSLAGLALAALSRGDPDAARPYVDEVLAWLADHGPAGVEYPIQVYLVCQQVLDALAARQPAVQQAADAALQAGHALLVEHCNNIRDEELRRQFISNLPFNQALHEAWLARSSPHQ